MLSCLVGEAQKRGIVTYYPRIREMRQLYDLTPQQLADRLYMDYNAYVACENGVFDFTVDQLVYLAELYETSIDYLLGLTDSSAPHYR